MEIRYERPLPDLTFLVHAPLALDLGGGQVAPVEYWCLEGVRPPEGLRGESGTARLTIPFHGFDISFEVTLRRDASVNLMRFVDLGPREERVLKHFYREIVTGRAVAMDRMITAMDTPVEPVPMGETKAEREASKARMTPRAIRAASVAALYAGLITLLHEPVLKPVWHRMTEIAAAAEEGAATALGAIETRTGMGAGGAPGAGTGGGAGDGAGTGAAPGSGPEPGMGGPIGRPVWAAHAGAG
jgi:hypothetical protein